MREELLIDQPAQIKAMESDVRLQITDWLLTQGPLTARELAQGIGLRRTAIFHHLAILLEAGLVEKADGEDADKYQAVAISYRIDRSKRTAGWNEALGSLAAAVLRGLTRKFRAAYVNPDVVRSANLRENQVLWSRSVCRLSAEELAEVSMEIQAVVEGVRERGIRNFGHPDVGKLYNFAAFLVPEEEHSTEG